ncbi:MAG: carbon-nitrogen hydrolase family protein [Planctomycetaceae bacterium]|jgi:nitrilase|nr:carbon-nitrogen hydrolase family protein [Planctomycetaceae bacterium]MBT6403721.1 carbon-nitrogen hydrolase family protein [Rhodospirillaceae bacterium]
MNQPAYKVAAMHAAPVYLNADKTADKACDLIAEAARAGAELIAFPESFIPGFPVWAALQPPTHGHDLFKAFVASSVRVDGPQISRIQSAARKHAVSVSVGFSESTSSSVGCIWNSNILISPDGVIVSHHRKLVPTFYEKLIWANGDGHGLRVHEIGHLGRIGMLICGENTNPLARYALIAQGEQVHISSYPPVWPTRPPGTGADYDLESAIRIRAGAHSFEGKVFNVVAAGAVNNELKLLAEKISPEARATLDSTATGASMIIGPTGTVISDVQSGEEAIVYCDIDLDECIEPKQFHDISGYYNRFDVFGLTVDQTRLEPAHFHDNTAPIDGRPVPVFENNPELRETGDPRE